MERIIFHCNINNCYASIERAENPELNGKPLAVCGDCESRQSIILAKSLEAKSLGVQTGETVWQARMKCPELITVKPKFDLYTRYSKAVRNIYYRFTDKIESFGLDECWLDITGNTKLFGDVTNVATLIKDTIKKELGITVSIGISYNKVFAKLASNLANNDSIKYIDKKNIKKEIWTLPASYLMGVERQISKKLNNMHINTIGDIANESKNKLVKILGRNGGKLWEFANGLENSPVSDCDFSTPVKSIGHGITIAKNLKNNEDIWHLLFALTETVGKKLRLNRLAASGIQITIRDSQLKNHVSQCMLASPTQSSISLSRQAYNLFTKNQSWISDIRSISIRAINLVPYGSPYQLDLWTDNKLNSKLNKIETTLDKLQDKFDTKLINYDVLLYDPSHYSFDRASARCV